jgi:hypothetical protein
VYGKEAGMIWPQTRIGWLAAWSFAVFVVLYIINGVMIKASAQSQWWLTVVLPYFGNALLVTVIMASLGGVVAWFIRGDGAWAVRAATLPIWVWLTVRVFIAVITVLGW